jgi:hypothetical protein
MAIYLYKYRIGCVISITLERPTRFELTTSHPFKLDISLSLGLATTYRKQLKSLMTFFTRPVYFML